MKRIELVIGLALCLLLAVGISVITSWYLTAKKAEGRAAVLTSASAGVAAGAKSDKQAQAITAGLAEGRAQFHDTKEKAKRHEPTTRDRADTAVPVSLLDAYRARRLARERLGCAGRECSPRR